MTALVHSLNQSLARLPKIDWLLVILLTIPAAVAVLDPERLGALLQIAGSALAQTAIYVAIAIGLLAYLKATGADALVARAFTGSPLRMIVLAALVGGLAPFCSCEVIPFIAGLLALGAPLSAVMAFWLSSPVMDPAQFAITAGALGWDYAIAKTLAAVGMGLLGGTLVLALGRVGALADPLKIAPKRSCCGCGSKPYEQAPLWAFWQEEPRRAVFWQTLLEQSLFLLRWLALAYLLEGLMKLYVPAELIAGLVGGTGTAPILISALLGIPAYLNGSAAPPMIAALIEQGMQPGAGIAFMVGGAVSSIPAMAAVWSLVKREVFALYLGLGLSGAVLAGLIFQSVIGSQ
ncbi:MAG: permease [Neomegalonema sp.]|nr:permease [Neomegalonema sp.]